MLGPMRAAQPASSSGRCSSRRALPYGRRRVAVAAAATTHQIPIFPLNMVALPACQTPLVIFEARYRVLFNTLLANEPGVEEGLVQKESAICGTKKFGMCYMEDGRLASVGTLLEIEDFAHMQDGRIFVTSRGKQRFAIKSVVKEKPVLMCDVEFIEPDSKEQEEESSPEAIELSKEVADLMRSTIKLNVKMKNITASEDQLEPEELAELNPRDLSFFVAGFFGDVKVLQQNLLEENSTVKRLQCEKEILTDTVKYFSAAAALKDIGLPSSSPSSSSSDDKK